MKMDILNLLQNSKVGKKEAKEVGLLKTVHRIYKSHLAAELKSLAKKVFKKWKKEGKHQTKSKPTPNHNHNTPKPNQDVKPAAETPTIPISGDCISNFLNS